MRTSQCYELYIVGDVEKLVKDVSEAFGHFTSCFTVFLMLLVEVIFFSYTSRDLAPPMLRRIKSYGIKTYVILLEKAFFPFILRVILLAAAYAFMGTFSLSAFLLALPCLALISVISISFSALLSQSTLGISVIFALCSLGLFLSGGLLPRAMLPAAITRFGDYTPFGLAARVLSPSFGGDFDTFAFVFLAVTAAVIFTLALFYLERSCMRGGAKK